MLHCPLPFMFVSEVYKGEKAGLESEPISRMTNEWTDTFLLEFSEQRWQNIAHIRLYLLGARLLHVE